MLIPKIFKPSPRTILLQWEPIIAEKVQQSIRQTEQVVANYFNEEILEMTPTYNELALYLKEGVEISEFEQRFMELLQQKVADAITVSSRLVTIPVCYETEFAPDLTAVATYHNISEEEVIKLHSQTVYKVAFIGFLPGFPYLTGLSEKLHTPRKKTPRSSVAKGSIGIGGKQTGVYPSNSPGGWNLIGRTPLEFFSLKNKQPSLLKAGDKLKFQAVSKAEFSLISIEVASGIYQVKTQAL